MNKGFTLIEGLVIFLIVSMVLFIVAMPFVTIRYQTSSGEHTGYVTAVEKNGIIWKTGRAYVKTDTMSSQEDKYCVIDPDVYQQLQQYAATKTHVNVYYIDWLKKGLSCEHEDGIITKVVAAN